MRTLGLGLGLSSGRAPLWTPANASGLLLWLRADKGIHQVAGAVSQWDDQSSHGFNATQATGAAKPTFHASGGPNGLAYLSFAGAQNLVGGGLVTGADRSFVIVHQFTSTASFQVSFHLDGGASSGVASTIDVNGQGERDVLSWQGAQFQADAAASATMAWEAWIITEHQAGPLATLHVNGASRTLTPNNATYTPSGLGGFTIGSRTGGSTFLTGGIGEVFALDHVVIASELASINGYLQARYGL